MVLVVAEMENIPDVLKLTEKEILSPK